VGRAGTRLDRLTSGVIVPGELPMADRLAHIFDALGGILDAGGIDAVAIETAFCGHSPRSALALGQARGVALAAAARAHVQVFEFAPAEVKRAFTGNGRADKGQMVRTAKALFGIAARAADEADALAIAVCCLARSRAAPARPAGPRRRTSEAGVTLGANGQARFGRLRSSVRRFAGA
jgi:crossover junction endodeoxyribonuclease RuvC